MKLPFVGHMPYFWNRSYPEALMRLAQKHGPLCRVHLPGTTFWLVSDAAHLERVLDERVFEKRIVGSLKELQRIAGQGLFTADTDNPLWSRARRLLSAGFHAKAVQSYHEEMLRLCKDTVSDLERCAGPRGETSFEPLDVFSKLTLEIIARCAFGHSFEFQGNAREHPFVRALGRVLFEAGEMVKLTKWERVLSRSRLQRYSNDIAFLQSTVDGIVENRRRVKQKGVPTESEDLLSLLLAEDPEEGTVLPLDHVRDQLLTFLVAGYETTSSSLAFLCANVAARPAVQERLVEEVVDCLGDRNVETITFAEVTKLRYVQAVIHENLRLWSPAAAYSLSAKSDIVVKGQCIRENDRVLVFPWGVHRDRAVWGDSAEEFRPERFLVPAKSLPESYRPFGSGKRSCIGRFFALQEMTLLVTILFSRFHLSLENGFPFELGRELIVKPKNLRLKARLRSKA